MDVTSLYTNIPPEEGITTVCNAYEKFHNYKPPIPSHYLKDMLSLILKENSFQFIENNSSTHISPPATHQAWKEVLLKVKPWDFLEQILLRQRLARGYDEKMIQRCPKYTLKTDSRPFNKNQNQRNSSCHLLRHTTHRCVILKIYSCPTGIE